MAHVSTVPAALPALAAALHAWPPLAGVQVSDGPPSEESDALEAIAVGYNPEEDIYAADVNTTPQLGARAEEAYPVECSLGVLNGDMDLQAARDRAFGLLDAVADLLTANKTLGGVVMSAVLTGYRLRQSRTDAGMLARINFTVSVRAFTSR